jgi:hypothetical protein
MGKMTDKEFPKAVAGERLQWVAKRLMPGWLQLTVADRPQAVRQRAHLPA